MRADADLLSIQETAETGVSLSIVESRSTSSPFPNDVLEGRTFLRVLWALPDSPPISLDKTILRFAID